MPKIADEWSALKVRRANAPGRHPVGGVPGLLLQITESGAKSWVLRVMVGGRRRDVGLGPYPGVTLAGARDLARELRQEIRRGIDPVAERQAARYSLKSQREKERTFKECAEAFLAAKSHEWSNRKHASQWRSTLEAYAYPIIGSLPVQSIEFAHIVGVLEPIWLTKTETASRLRGRIESVLAYATASGFRHGDNPARWRGNLDAVLPKPKKLAKVKHHKALPVDDLPKFWKRLQAVEGTGARALAFTILTAARSGEVRGAQWDEIDLKAKTWTVPASRMKSGREHVVPLSAPALRLLKALPARSGLVFPAPRGGQLSDMTLSAVLRRMEVDATVHGFRSVFRDWASERTAYPREVCEQALAHSLGAVERAYRRSDLLEKRRRLMEDWAKFFGTVSTGGEVSSIRAARVAPERRTP